MNADEAIESSYHDLVDEENEGDQIEELPDDRRVDGTSEAEDSDDQIDSFLKNFW